MSKAMLMSGLSTHTYTFLKHRVWKLNPKSSSSRLVFRPLSLVHCSGLLESKRKEGNGILRTKEVSATRVDMIGLKEEAKSWVATMVALIIALVPIGSTYIYSPPSLAALEIDTGRGADLFRNACIGCHDAGGNLIQPGATLFAKDLERNGVAGEEEIYNITYSGKGRMPGFGEKCTPRGSCTFGPRLQDEDIRVLAQFVKSQADQGWRTLP
ncbi:hypothetical protein vseg_000503 [Gypsophila vaccaria]